MPHHQKGFTMWHSEVDQKRKGVGIKNRYIMISLMEYM